MRPLTTFLVLAVTACSSTKPTPSEPIPSQPDAPSAAPAAPLTPLAEAMREHWALATRVRDALTRGELEEARESARELARHEPSPAVPDWTVHVDSMHSAASRAHAARNLSEASVSTAEIAATCGQCHVEMGAELRSGLSEPPPATTNTSGHMARHAWASNALWWGLVAPSDDAWLAGAEVLADRPLHDHEFFDGWRVTAEITDLGVRVHDIGIRARSAELEDRPNIYADLIQTCADCHSNLFR